MAEIDYKKRYDDLKIKFLRSTDIAWRQGYQQGMKDAQLDVLRQSQAQAAANPGMPQAMAGGPGGDPNAQGISPDAEGVQSMPNDLQPQEGAAGEGGDEMDQSIAELESLVNKSENPSLMKALVALKSLPRKQTKTHTSHGQVVSDILDKWDNKDKKVEKSILDIITEKNS
jgi:hypothetical protein